MDYISLGKRVCALRGLQSLTQEQLAERCGLSPAYIGHIENGARVPSLQTLVSLAGILHTTLDFLVLGEGQASTLSKATQDR